MSLEIEAPLANVEVSAELQRDININNMRGYALEISAMSGEEGVKNFFITNQANYFKHAGKSDRETPCDFVELDVIDEVIDYIVEHSEVAGFNQQDADYIRSRRPSINN